MRFLSLTLLLISLAFSGLHAQDEEVQQPQDLSSQYDYLKSNSETFNEYKVIKEVRLDEFWKTVADSVAGIKQSLATSNQTIDEQSEKLNNLQSTIDEKEAEMALADHAMTHISFLGIDFSKSTYIIINVIIISTLILLIAAGYFQYTHNKNNALEKIKSLADVEEKFEEFKKIAFEKQIRLNRELQTERNIVEEMHSKTTITKKISA